MSMHKPKKLEREALKLLRSSGLPFRIQEGSKHHKVFIREEMVCVLAKGSCGFKDTTLLQRMIKQRLPA